MISISIHSILAHRRIPILKRKMDLILMAQSSPQFSSFDLLTHLIINFHKIHHLGYLLSRHRYKDISQQHEIAKNRSRDDLPTIQIHSTSITGVTSILDWDQVVVLKSLKTSGDAKYQRLYDLSRCFP